MIQFNNYVRGPKRNSTRNSSDLYINVRISIKGSICILWAGGGGGGGVRFSVDRRGFRFRRSKQEGL